MGFRMKGILMRSFDYSKLAEKAWDNEILNLVAKIHECKGRQDLFVRQKPVDKRLLRLITPEDILPIEVPKEKRRIGF